MARTALLYLCCSLFFAGTIDVKAQSKTIILVRHAEKAEMENQQNPDPGLSADGMRRAERLMNIVKKYRPGAIYTTDFKRTRETASPMAAQRKLQLQTYDPKKPNELIDAIMKSKTKRFMIVGHSNTIPGLANLLGRKELFKNLDESEYGTIWIIRIKNGQVRRTEVLPY